MTDCIPHIHVCRFLSFKRMAAAVTIPGLCVEVDLGGILGSVHSAAVKTRSSSGALHSSSSIKSFHLNCVISSTGILRNFEEGTF